MERISHSRLWVRQLIFKITDAITKQALQDSPSSSETSYMYASCLDDFQMTLTLTSDFCFSTSAMT